MATVEPEGSELHRWVLETGEGLGVDPDAVDVELLLDLARDVAHAVARPAVPVTAYLVGFAVARSGGDHASLERIAREVLARAGEWELKP